MTTLKELASLVGFHESYIDSFGQQIKATDESRLALLEAMGYEVASDEQISRSIETLLKETWSRLLPQTQILKSEDEIFSVVVSMNVQDINKMYIWEIETEKGEVLTGELNLNKSDILESKEIDSILYQRYQFDLPSLKDGYHSLEILSVSESSRSGLPSENGVKCNLIVAPKLCYGPKDVSNFKMWGFAAQLYSLKSNNSWGIGDFGDLDNLVSEAAKKGASTIGLNPLHPLFPGNTAHRSPYSPTSRSFLNTIYIDVTRVANYSECKEAIEYVKSTDFQHRLMQVNASNLIDYPKSATLKYEVLEKLYEHFVIEHLRKSTILGQSFNKFRDEFGDDLTTLATFDALYEHFRAKDFHSYGWQSWPEGFKTPNSSEVKKFQREHSKRIGYFEFIQWVADTQLSDVALHGKNEGMQIGLYLDLAVGCDGGGADIWSNHSAYVSGASIGAPPDAANLLGQDWGLTPINPQALKEQGFKPLTQALRSNMRHAGALRIDHVLGYMRQFWIPQGMKADKGIYISFPFEDMLRVIALESQRTKCIVIGEDLGTTPEGFGDVMAASGLLSYRLLYFERWDNGVFKRPEFYPEQSMVTVSTHDLPTLNGWWTGKDLEWREKLHLYPNEELEVKDRSDRILDRKRLISAMQDMDLLEQDLISTTDLKCINSKLSTAVQRFLARASSRIQLIPMEDALCLQEQVNIPGTIDEHPNWLQKLPYNIDEIWQQTSMQEIVDVMNQERDIP